MRRTAGRREQDALASRRPQGTAGVRETVCHGQTGYVGEIHGGAVVLVTCVSLVADAVM